MIYTPATEQGMQAAIDRLKFHAKMNQSVTIEVFKNTRTSQQNRALHKFFQMVADMLNEKGQTFKVLDEFESQFTGTIVKECIWKPIQLVMFGTDSTKKLKTNEINIILDVLSDHFSKIGEVVEFPSIENLQANLY
jgi:hypothetical protein